MSAEPAGGLVPPGLPEVRLHRLHPLTPFIRGWKIYVAFAAVLVQQIGLARNGGATYVLIALGAALPVAALVGWVTWLTTTYGFTGEDLRIDSGILVRRSRRVRLDRLQAVDVVRPLLARLAGLAELRLEVVGGAKSEGGLAYLSEGEASRLRSELLARAAGLEPLTESSAPREDADEHLLHEVPWGRYVASIVLSPATLIGLVMLGSAVGVAVGQRSLAPLAVLLPAVVLPAFQLLGRGQIDAGFSVSGAADGLRLRHGLLESRQQTVPTGRVQAIRMVAPLLWRPFGWVRLEIAVAGYGPARQALTGTLLPVAPREEALSLVDRVLGAEVGVPASGANRLDSIVLHPAPRRARWVDPLGWSVLGVGVDNDVLVTRSGRLRRVLDVVPHAKVQSLRLRQGPLQRRLGLVSLHVDLPPHIAPQVRHRAPDDARELMAAEVELARAARERARPSR